MELQIKEYDKEIEINYLTGKNPELHVTGKATLHIKETYEPSSMFHDDFYDDELLDVKYDVKAEVEETGEPVSNDKIPAIFFENLTDNFKEYVKKQYPEYITVD